MNPCVLADSRLSILDRINLAADMVRSGPTILHLLIGSSEAAEGETETAVIREALRHGWMPQIDDINALNPTHWLKAVTSIAGYPVSTRNAAARALEGKSSRNPDIAPISVLIIALKSSDGVREGEITKVSGIKEGLAAGWKPDPGMIASAISYDADLVKICPSLANCAKA